MIRIAHLTSVHPRFDTRIFLKECRSLAAAGYGVSLVVADGKGDEVVDNISIHDVGNARGRLDRMLGATRRVFAKAKALNADIYHFHDPELIPIGLKLKRLGKRVIFDSHEDVPKQILSKEYLSTPVKWLISRVIAVYERFASRRFDAIVAATPFIRDKFLKINAQTLDINNFPMLGELASDTEAGIASKERRICYVGGIGILRGIREAVRAMEQVTSGIRLQLAGTFSEDGIEAEVKTYPGWASVDQLGFLNREQVRALMARSVAGVVTFLPAPNHLDAQPNKMFEYMSAGLPVIASNFPLWREIIEGNDCGLCVDPLDTNAIARAVDFLAAHPERAREMGGNGLRAVMARYNWEIEEQKLLALYGKLSAS
jgi:glycosyltransferase involved in cell wall biosynthesis